MSEANKEIVRRYQEAYNTNNLDVLDELLSPDAMTKPRAMPGLRSGFDGEDVTTKGV